MDLKEAYIDRIICHHFSIDAAKCLINNSPMSIEAVDVATLNDFFINPFKNVKAEYAFSHPVDLGFNVVYQTVIRLLGNADFVDCSHDIFRHLQSALNNPQIKEGDVFVAHLSDILIDNTFYDGLGIYKIDQKSEFIETYIDENGDIQFAVKTGFLSNKIDKACLIVMAETMPICYAIDKSKETKSWQQDFLGLIPRPNAYTQSKAAVAAFESFVKEELPRKVQLTKDEQISLINKMSGLMRNAESINLPEAVKEVCGGDENIVTIFRDYCRVYEEKEKVDLSGAFKIDNKAVTTHKRLRTIRLDDSAEICLLKTGPFLERGFDEKRGMSYYKLFFSQEK